MPHEVLRGTTAVLLGQGKEGIVVLGRCKGVEVALKRTDWAQSEAEMLRRVQCEHVVQLLDHSPMQLVLERCWPVTQRPYAGAARMAQQLLSGLEHVHRCGVVHRDLKVDNLLLTEAGSIRITDFGLACLEPLDQLLSSRVGTMRYFAPELLSSHPYKAKPADVWAAGILIFELVSGKYIFRDRVGNGLTLTRLRQNIAAGPGDLDVGDDLDCPAGL